jgi:hypothetical protein
MTQEFEAMHRRRGWTWAGLRIMSVLWPVDTVELRDIARLCRSTNGRGPALCV